MKLYLFILLLMVFNLVEAQVQQVKNVATKADSLGNRVENSIHKTDTLHTVLQTATNAVTDSVVSINTLRHTPQNKIDSIERAFYGQSDSLKQQFKSKLSEIDAISKKLQHQKDSLSALNLPTEKYTRKIDSLNQKRKAGVTELNQKVDKLKSNTVGRLDELDLGPELNGSVSTATNNVDKFKLPAKDLNIPGLDMADNPMKNLDGLTTDINAPLAKVGNLNEAGRLGDVVNLGKIKGIQMPNELSQATDITKQAGQYTGDLKNISTGNLGDVKTLETKAADVSGLNEITGQTKVLDGYKDQVGQLQDPSATKEQAVQKVQEVAIDHFAGKEEVLRKAMDQVAKYKEKYSSLQSLEDAKKRRPNAMRGKPIRERLLPGIGFQVHRKNDLLVDFNPHLGYRFSGRFTSGMGWNQRWAYDQKKDRFHSRNRIFGPRAYAELNLFKGFFPRFEMEAMNTFIPTSFSSHTTDKGSREWVFSAFFGLKKSYKFLKKANGTTSVMFNLYNPKHKSPYADVVNVRFGFELPIKKNRKK
jgi:hypothetical protein